MNWTEWVKRRWYDIRNGYALYVQMVVGFLGFVLLISVKFESLSLIQLVLTIGTVSVVVTMVVGYFHRNHQLKTDQDSVFEQSRLAARVQLVIVKMIEGKATKEEIDWAKRLLETIAQ